MTYQAIIAKIDSIKPHSNADRLQLASVLGNTVIVGMDSRVGDIGIYFPIDGQLSEEFAKANNLISYKDEQGNKRGGFFSENRKVRAQKFRGEKSEGFFCSLSYLSYFLDDTNFTIGYSFDTMNGHPICNKYYTPATIREMARQKRSGIKFASFAAESFLKHVETNQLYRNIDLIADKSIIYLTFKLHGTSARFGNVWVERNNYNILPWYLKLATKLKLYNPKSCGYEFVNGTRNTVLDVNNKDFYESEGFRDKVASPYKDRLHEGEIIYGEIVGYTDTGKLIMPSISTKDLKDKGIEKLYGKNMTYKYGCSPDDPNNMFRFYVYRITRSDRKGNAIDLPWAQVKSRCIELGLHTVVEAHDPIFYVNEKYGVHQFSRNELVELVTSLKEGPDPLDHSHIREGVVLRIEPPIGPPYWLKDKSFLFGVLEGYNKEDENYIDMEEVS